VNLRDYERESIRTFVQSVADEGYLSGRVLDYGCGAQPYREIVEAVGGEYHGFDRKGYSGNVSGADVGEWEPWMDDHDYDAILCTQVIQYVPLPVLTERLYEWGHARDTIGVDAILILTYPTNWPEIEPEDLHRFTKVGMERLLTEAGFEIVRHEQRGVVFDPAFPSGRNKRITATGEEFALGYGVVCRA
jgi:hypothetical protein